MTTHAQGTIQPGDLAGPLTDTAAKRCPVTGADQCLCGYGTTEPDGDHAQGTLRGD